MASFRKRIVGGQARWDATVTRRGAPRQTRTFSTKGAADIWVRETERDIERGAWQSTEAAKRITVAALLTRYKDEVLPAKRSAKSLQQVARKLIRSDLAKIPLIGLTSERLAKYRDMRLSTRARGGGKHGRPLNRLVSSQTVRHELTLLKRAIDQGMREWGLHLPIGNPMRHVKLPPTGRARDRRLSLEEYARLLVGARESRSKVLAPAIELAVESAMRRTELGTLNWSEIDLNRRVAHLDITKNEEPRDVPLSSKAVAVLSKLPRPIQGGRVFGVKPGSLSQAFRRLCKKLGLENIRWHDLRHESTSRLAEKLDGDLMALSAITGHKTLTMLKRYTHLRAEDLARRIA